MRFSLVAVVSFLVTRAEAQNFSSYVPACVPPCVEQTLNSSKTCTGLDDNKCLCTNLLQVLFPSTICFMQTCNSTNEGELRSQVTSGWQRFCNDSGTPVNIPMGWNPGGPGGPEPNTSVTSSVTPSTTPIPLLPSSPTSSPASSSTSAPASPGDSILAPHSGLSTGAKAGIGVGAGLGALAVIGTLLALGFRLGQRKKRLSKSIPGSSQPYSEGHPDHGGFGTQGSATLPGSGTATMAAENGGEEWGYKSQLDGTALAELPSQASPDVELHAHDVNELPVHDRPAEMWQSARPSELSADAEVPRDRVLQNSEVMR